MTKRATHTPGPWGGGGGRGMPVVAKCKGIPSEIATVHDVNGRVPDDEVVANVLLIRAAPAYALAWSMVPDDVKRRIFDALHKPDTAWVEEAITRAAPQ